MIAHRTVVMVAQLLAFALAISRDTAQAQTIEMGRTVLSLGMSADGAVRSLKEDFVLQPHHDTYQTWFIQSRSVVGLDTTWRLEGQLVAKNGRVTSIMKMLSPRRPTSISVGEAVFNLLERIAGTGATCHVAVARSGIESAPAAGSTALSASIKCGQFTGTISQVQGSEETVSHETSLQYTLATRMP